MEHYIKKIFKKKPDERTHNKFIRYSKGTFTGPLITIRVMKSKIRIKSSFHIIDELIALAVKYSAEKNAHIKGTIVYNKDLSEEFLKIGLKYLKLTKSRGIYKYQIDNDLDLEEFSKIFLKYNPLINFSTSNVKLTSKKNFPKPNKEISKDFCYLELPKEAEKEVFKEFCFDIKDTPKTVEIEHTIIVDNITFPEKECTSFEEMRRKAIREGEIIRKVSYGDKIKESKFKFSV